MKQVVLDGVKYNVLDQPLSKGKPKVSRCWTRKLNVSNPKTLISYSRRMRIERLAGGAKPSINAI